MTEHANRSAAHADLEGLPLHLAAGLPVGALVTHPRPHPRYADATTSSLAPRSVPETLEVFQRQDGNGPLTPTTVIETENVSPLPFYAITFSPGRLRPFDTPSSEPTSNEQK